MAEKKFEEQSNYGWYKSFEANGPYPIIAKRIFPTYQDAEDFLLDPTAIPGLIISVIEDNDESLNGVYSIYSELDQLKLKPLSKGSTIEWIELDSSDDL